MAFFPPSQGVPGFPPFQQFPPSAPPIGQQPGGQAGPPAGPPPQFTPQQPSFATFAVDPGAISGCLRRFTYVWLANGEQFWFFPTFVGRRSVAGYRWFGWFWFYFGIDLRQINSFTCF